MKAAQKKLVGISVAFALLLLSAAKIAYSHSFPYLAGQLLLHGNYKLAMPLYKLGLQFEKSPSLEAASCFEGLSQCYEHAGEFHQSEVFYKQFLDMKHQLGFKDYGQGILAGLLDKQGLYAEADENYAKFEDTAISDHHFSFTDGSTVICASRALRLLSQIPEKKAKEEFDWAEQYLKRKRESCFSLGSEVLLVGKGLPRINDYRKPPSPSMESSSGVAFSNPIISIGGQPEAAQNSSSLQEATGVSTVIQGVNTAAYVMKGDEIHRRLALIGKEKALATFDFAKKGLDAHRGGKDLLGIEPLPGTTRFPRSLGNLVTELFILPNDDRDKLVKMSDSSYQSSPSLEGNWDYAFQNIDGSVCPGTFSLTQSANKIDANGVDGNGPFEIKGELSGKHITLKKSYRNSTVAAPIFLDGRIDSMVKSGKFYAHISGIWQFANKRILELPVKGKWEAGLTEPDKKGG